MYMYLLKVISIKLNLEIKNFFFVNILKKPLTVTSMVHAGNRTRRWRGGGGEHQEGSVFHKRHGRGRECGKARRAMKEMVRKGGGGRLQGVLVSHGRSGSVLQY
jgi:hypothetical protein